jgi:Ca-activated chloride channel family protein
MTRVAKGLIVSAFVAAAILLTAFGPSRRPLWWRKADQQGDKLLLSQNYSEAAKAYVDPARQGAALYRGGDFKAAAAAFARDGTPEGAFNRGNAFVMLGKYDDAIKSYDRALALRPDWKLAVENRALAVVRRERLKTEGADDGGQSKPDKIVFGKGKNPAGEAVQIQGGEPLSDDQLRALWLRRVQTRPADFLRGKFAYQLQQQEGEAK